MCIRDRPKTASDDFGADCDGRYGACWKRRCGYDSAGASAASAVHRQPEENCGNDGLFRHQELSPLLKRLCLSETEGEIRRMKKIILLLAAALLVLVSETAVFAESAFVPYNSYTYDANEKPVYVPNAFSPEETVSGESMGVGAFLEPEDLFTGQDGRVYVLDTGNNRVVIADKTLSEGKALQDFTFNGVGQMLAAPRGLFVDEKGNLYICDTGNRRLVISDQNGTISRIIEKPSDREFPQDTEFEPEKIVVDKNGSMYVICSNIYQGAVVFSAEGAFEGYFGATKIQSSLQIIWQMCIRDR